ncbi:MAG: Holliday junction branch migration protein RuvA [Verrucomicrobia bacterium]|nr:Holliday junction branch migration protein RuvA [Verrucomicrobiota bacterium]
MITSIQGVLAAATPLSAVIELNGLGYEVHIPVTTAERLPAIGATVKLHTHVVYREDAQTLYGFATLEDRDFFRLLIDHVSGVGPKLATSIMSKLSVASLESAIRSGDLALLAKSPGIGKKTAERLIVELRGKIGPGPTGTGISSPAGDAAVGRDAAPPSGSGRSADAVKALVALGYKAADADEAVRRAALALGAGATTEQLIKSALA